MRLVLARLLSAVVERRLMIYKQTFRLESRCRCTERPISRNPAVDQQAGSGEIVPELKLALTVMHSTLDGTSTAPMVWLERLACMKYRGEDTGRTTSSLVPFSYRRLLVAIAAMVSGLQTRSMHAVFDAKRIQIG